MAARTRTPAPTLGDTIAQAAREGYEGDVVLSDRARRLHRVTMRSGRVVGVRVAGRFDPLLDRLTREGALEVAKLADVFDALARSTRRVGELAVEIGGSSPEAVRAALRAQLRDRLTQLLALAERDGSTPRLEARSVRPREQEGELPWREAVQGATRARDLDDANRPPPVRPSKRRAETTPEALAERSATHAVATREELRRLALACHPDRTRHLPPAEQDARAALLARATAAFHGLRES
jgi:hypothetical protein